MTRKRNGGRSDRELGMHRAITRRDFVQGAAVGSAGLLAAAWLPGCSGGAPDLPMAAQDRAGYYPPSLTGMRGSHPGSFENAHALRDGTLKAEPVDLHLGGGPTGVAQGFGLSDESQGPGLGSVGCGTGGRPCPE